VDRLCFEDEDKVMEKGQERKGETRVKNDESMRKGYRWKKVKVR
jgi:hypothetical protein